MNQMDEHSEHAALNSFYAFIDSSPLNEYIQRKFNSVQTNYTLGQILSQLKKCIRDQDLLDATNNSIILCDAELEVALDQKALHVGELKGCVLRQLIRLNDNYQAELARQYAEQVSVYYGGTGSSLQYHQATTSGADPSMGYSVTPDNSASVYLDDSAMFEPSNGLRAVLATRPTYFASPAFSYKQIILWIQEYVLAKKHIFFDARNLNVALIQGDLLSVAFGKNTVHRRQISKFIRKNVFFISASASTSLKHQT